MKTLLYDIHKTLGAKLVDFCGWEMPIQYQSIIHEHHVVRNQVGLFDVSHMGRIIVEGSDALPFLNYLSTNDLSNKADGTATYTVWCAENGSCIDDLIIYQESSTKFFMIVNASNREKDLTHLQDYATNYNVTVTPKYEDEGIFALQGPKAEIVLAKLFPEVVSLKHMHFTTVSYKNQYLLIARTGYTGTDGFELYIPNELVIGIWNQLLELGKSEGIEPIGLGARNTLRLEMGYALYGHELSDSIAATESVSTWTIKWGKPDFLGKKALEMLKNGSAQRHEYGVILVDKGIARDGYLVFHKGQEIGYVTSGTLSPTLNQSIAIILVTEKLQLDDRIEIKIRQDMCQARVVPLPFLRVGQ